LDNLACNFVIGKCQGFDPCIAQCGENFATETTGAEQYQACSRPDQVVESIPLSRLARCRAFLE
jgi:hypothetical protein